MQPLLRDVTASSLVREEAFAVEDSQSIAIPHGGSNFPRKHVVVTSAHYSAG